MVAQAFVPSLESVFSLVSSAGFGGLRGRFPDPSASNTVKILDLLTNRYYTGVVRARSELGLELELPLSSRLHAGQRVRFVVAGNEPLIAKHAMKNACIMHVDRTAGDRLHVELALTSEAAAA